jgi:hypothetical protein
MSSKLCGPALAALTLAAIASSVMAEPRRDTNIPLSTDNVLWGEANKRPYGYGSVAHPPAGRRAPGVAIEPAHPRILDCIHVTFPQCSDGG